MRRGVAVLASQLVALAAVVAQPQSPDPNSYPFAQYRVDDIFKGKSAPPKLVTAKQRTFRTVLREGASKGPNFSGHYTIVEWGCGAGCVSFAVIEARTGQIFDRGLPATGDYPCGLQYKVDSALFVVEKSATIDSPCQPTFYKWTDSRFVAVENPAH